MRRKIGFSFFALGLLASATAAWAQTVTVNAGTTYQTISGFGAASVWCESKISAAIANVLWTDDSTLAPASQVNGHVGLSIIRIIIDDGGSGNWGTAINSAKQALAINPNVRVFASEWSPPGSMKNNGKAAGNNTGNDNFNPGSNTNQINTANYSAYATFQTNFVNTCKTNGFTPYAISVQNEPDYDTSYQSCLWSPQMFDTYIGTYLGPALNTAGYNPIIMMPESFADNLTGSNTAMGDANAAKYVKVIGAHLYGGGPNTVPASYSTTAGHAVESWETEISDFAAVDDSITSGLKYANQLHNCIVDHNFNAYNYWWIYSLNADNEGLYDNNGNASKRLYTIGNFSKFIRPGFTRISCTEAPSAGVSVSAYYSSSAGKVVVVAINNNGSAQNLTVNLSGLSASTVYPWITDSSRSLVQQASVAVTGGSFTYSLPAQSVVSFVASVATGSTATPTFTPTGTPSPTRTNTPTSTPSYTPTATATFTRTNTLTSTPSATPTASPTATRSNTPTATATASTTPTPSPTGTPSATPSSTTTKTATATRTSTASSTASSTSTATATNTLINSATPTNTATKTPTATTTNTPLNTASSTPSATPTNTLVNSATPTNTLTKTATSTPTNTTANTTTSTPTATATNTFINSPTPTGTPTKTPTSTITASTTPTPSATLSSTVTNTATTIATGTATNTPTFTPTLTTTRTTTFTPTNTLVNTATAASTPSLTPTAVTVSASQGSNPPGNSNQLAGASNVTVQQLVLANPSTSTINITGLTLSVSGTGSPADITGVTLWANGTAITTTTFTGGTAVYSFGGTLSASSSVTFTVTANFGTNSNGTYGFSLTGAAGTNGQAVQFSGLPVAGAIVTVAQATGTPTSTTTNTPTFTPSTVYTFTPSLTPTLTPLPLSTFTPSFTPPGNMGVVVYPNPSTGPTVNVLAPAYGGTKDVRVKIFTVTFRKVLDETFRDVASGTAVTVHLNDQGGMPLANGLYYAVVTVDGRHSVSKFLVLH